MTAVASQEEEYAEFVTRFHKLHPQIVESTYRRLYSDSECWNLPLEEAIEALAEQDAFDGEDAWAFRDEFAHGLP